MAAGSSKRSFPDGFVWGVATSSYQIEGDPLADGASPSIWHTFCRTPGKIKDATTGDRACEHLQRYPEDIRLMADLGVRSYRFSIAWPRVKPGGRGPTNPAGLDFYSRLVDGLLAAGIEPAITLYHWDLPQCLQDVGGWLNRSTACHFADYASACYAALGDRCKLWITLNEPWVVAYLGYGLGIHAPGVVEGGNDAAGYLQAGLNLLLAHGMAVQAYRGSDAGDGQIGITVNLSPAYPVPPNEENRLAAMRQDAFSNEWFLDPILLGQSSATLAETFGRFWVEPADADWPIISEPIDFVGVNYYSPGRIEAAEGGFLGAKQAAWEAVRSSFGWEVYPDGLYDILQWIRRRYGNLAIYVTENGCSCDDDVAVGADAQVVEDRFRVDFLRGHFAAAARAIAHGVDLRGYYVWSLMDNFEWAEGYTKRFGLVHVDFATQRRTPKRSYHFLRDVIRANAVETEV